MEKIVFLGAYKEAKLNKEDNNWVKFIFDNSQKQAIMNLPEEVLLKITIEVAE